VFVKASHHIVEGQQPEVVVYVDKFNGDVVGALPGHCLVFLLLSLHNGNCDESDNQGGEKVGRLTHYADCFVFRLWNSPVGL
jgi:hypothetical protein